MGTSGYPPRESGRDDFTPRDCLADRRCFAPARRRTRRARARNLRLELLSCHPLSRPRYFSTPGPRQITRSFRVAGTAPIGGQSSMPIDNKSSLSANIRRDSAIHTGFDQRQTRHTVASGARRQSGVVALGAQRSPGRAQSLKEERVAAGQIEWELLKEPRMSQRPLLFVVMVACLCSMVSDSIA
jgi:hypothetical protein